MKKILIIEDDSVLQKLYHDIFKDEGLTVSQAMNSNDALRLLKAPPPDIILLDIMIPGGKNGYDIFREIKLHDKWKDVPIIIITNLKSGEKESAIKSGADDYIHKTEYTPDDLIKKVNKLLKSSSAS